MSLINEALRKARLEAARQDAAHRGVTYPAGELPPRRPPIYPILAAIVLVGAAGGLLYWLGARSARNGVEVADAKAAVDNAGSVIETRPPLEPIAGAPPSAADTTPQPTRDAEPTSSASPPPAAATPRAAEPPPPARTEPRGRPTAPPERTAVAPAPASTTPAPARSPAPARTEPAPATAPPREPAPSAPDQTAAAPPVTAAPEPPPAGAETFVGEASIPGVGQLRLGGIAWSERQPFALINGRVVGRGDRIQGLLVDSIGRSEVVLRADGGATYVLRLR